MRFDEDSVIWALVLMGLLLLTVILLAVFA